MWYEPITKYVPELVDKTTTSSERVQWDSILLVDLASQLAGVPREGTMPLK